MFYFSRNHGLTPITMRHTLGRVNILQIPQLWKLTNKMEKKTSYDSHEI